MIYEIINPSDKVTIEASNETLASVVAIILGEGAYGLYNETGEVVLPIFRFSKPDVLYSWLRDKGIDNDKIQEYYAENGVEMANILESIVYGDAGDRQALNALCKDMTPEERVKSYARWNDAKRSSMNDIGTAAHGLAKELRSRAVAPNA